MPAYVAVQAEVTDPERFKQYLELAGPTVVAFGGKVLSVGSATDLRNPAECAIGGPGTFHAV